MAKIIPNKTWKPVALANNVEAALGAGAGAPSSTVILSFIPPSQWPLMPQMYHFVPAVANLIVSFPVNEPKLLFDGTVQLLNSSPVTLYTL
ncbi:hypothetical protein V6N13_063972 [Hibiscus sabdariffa]